MSEPASNVVVAAMTAAQAHDVLEWITVTAPETIEADTLEHAAHYSSPPMHLELSKRVGNVAFVVHNDVVDTAPAKKVKNQSAEVNMVRFTLAQAKDGVPGLAEAVKRLIKDTCAHKDRYKTRPVLKVTVTFRGVSIVVGNANLPTRVSAPSEKGETTEKCHEAANFRPKAECVKCTGCTMWFHSNCVVKKFKDDVATIRANPVWTCWHCRGVCCLHSCVAKREGGKIANTIESDVGNGAKYFTLITEATVAGYTSVRAHFDAIDHEKKW